MEVSSIRLRVVHIEHIPVVVGRCRNQICEAKVALNDKAGLDPLVSAGLFVEFDRLEITDARVIVVVTVGFDVLVVNRARYRPVVVHQPTNRCARTHPLDIIDVIGNCRGVGLATAQAGQTREPNARVNSCAQHVVDEAGVSRAETRQADSDVVT